MLCVSIGVDSRGYCVVDCGYEQRGMCALWEGSGGAVSYGIGRWGRGAVSVVFSEVADRERC